jgi:DNA-binding response OmpR family regulator
MATAPEIQRAELPVVLLVLDCPTTQTFLELALADDCAVVTTHDPDIALRLLGRVSMAAVVVDLDLAPRGAGALLAELRAEGDGAAIVPLAASEGRDEPLEGCGPALAKPVDRGRLLATLLRILEEKSARAAPLASAPTSA